MFTGKKGKTVIPSRKLQAVVRPLPFRLANTPIFNIQSTLNLIPKQHSLKKRWTTTPTPRFTDTLRGCLEI